MSTDLVKALRNCVDCCCGDCEYRRFMKPPCNFVKCMDRLISDAADEIIRLREANNDLREKEET